MYFQNFGVLNKDFLYSFIFLHFWQIFMPIILPSVSFQSNNRQRKYLNRMIKNGVSAA